MIELIFFSYSFPQKDLYKDITFTLEKGQHCAFIGASGSGKTTLVDIIMDPESFMYDGDLDIDPQTTIGYVQQFSQQDQSSETTVFEYIGEKFIALQKEIDEICAQMATASDLEELLEKYQIALDAFDAINGDSFESDINKKLNLADMIKHKDLKVSELSGGEFKLVQVIKEMMNRPDVMIMDEPDVFLDFENLSALKNLINAHKGILLVITHSRYLLNQCFNKIIHLENKEIQEFNGRYVDYNYELLQSKIELQELALADEEEISKNDNLIDKLRISATHNSESSRGKALKARVKIQERLEARRIKAPFVAIKQPEIYFQTDKPLEDTIVLKVNNYTASFDELLLENVTFEIGAKDKVALIGSNGTGKTTLLRDIQKNNHPSITIDPSVKVGYVSQLQGEVLDESNTILQEFFDVGFKSKDDIIAYLFGYGFFGDIIYQKISSLSGGEKNTIQLARVAATKGNLLLLDEPTSHLDTYSQVALEKAIENYNGAILMISHDYYSIANCMDYVLLIEGKTIRKMTIRKFKKMVFTSHFDREFFEMEEKKKTVEMDIAHALKATDFELAKKMSVELEALIKTI